MGFVSSITKEKAACSASRTESRGVLVSSGGLITPVIASIFFEARPMIVCQSVWF